MKSESDKSFGIRDRVNTGAIVNNGASTTWGRPGGSPAEKFRAFSRPDAGAEFPRFNSLPVASPDVNLNPQGLTDRFSLRDPSQYRLVRTLDPEGKEVSLMKDKKEIRKSSSEDANQIDTNVFIGNSTAAQNLDWMMSTGITNVVNTAAEIPNFFDGRTSYRGPYHPRYFNLKLKDNPTPGDEDLLAVLESTYRYISNVIRLNPKAKILVHCHMGKSRSASVVIYYLMRSRGWSFDEALAFAQSKRGIVSPNDWYARQLKDTEILLHS